MGFTNTEFTNRDGTSVHFELKDGPRIVLWDEFESKKLLDLIIDQAVKARDDLTLLIQLSGNDDQW